MTAYLFKEQYIENHVYSYSNRYHNQAGLTMEIIARDQKGSYYNTTTTRFTLITSSSEQNRFVYVCVYTCKCVL